MAAAKGDGRAHKKRLSAKAAMSESVTLGQGPTSSSSSAAPAPAAAAAAAVAAAPAVPAAPASALPSSPLRQQNAAPAPNAQGSNESGFKARLVRLDLLPDGQQDVKPLAASGLPWESDASLHPSGTFSTPAVIYLGAQPEVKLGRNPQHCAVVLDCPDVPQMISRVHARLVCAEGTWVLTDEKSVNGVLVNGTSVQAPKVFAVGTLSALDGTLPINLFSNTFLRRNLRAHHWLSLGWKLRKVRAATRGTAVLTAHWQWN